MLIFTLKREIKFLTEKGISGGLSVTVVTFKIVTLIKCHRDFRLLLEATSCSCMHHRQAV